MRSGHIVVDGSDRLVSIDGVFSGIMGSPIPSLLGRPVLDITAPADRDECGEAIVRLRRTREPFELSKRFIRDDGSLVWVTNSVSVVGNGHDTDLLVATVAPIVDPASPRAPAALLGHARLLVDLQHARARAFDRSLLSDIGWHAMLAAYIAEAEGRAITVAALAARLGISDRVAQRWIAVLIGQGVAEIETRETDPMAPKSFRLTAAAHRRLEEHLARTGALLGGPVGAMTA